MCKILSHLPSYVHLAPKQDRKKALVEQEFTVHTNGKISKPTFDELKTITNQTTHKRNTKEKVKKKNFLISVTKHAAGLRHLL